MIPLPEVAPGDEVIIQDQQKNLARGPVVASDDQHRQPILTVEAFGQLITFARATRAGTMRLVPGVRLVGHTPLLIGGAADGHRD